MNWNQRAFNIAAGFGVFIGATLLLSDYDPNLAVGIIGVATAYLVLSHTPDIQKLIGQFQSSLKG